jgi:DNA transformation protein and related proteins
MTKPTKLKNLGAKTTSWLNQIGVYDIDDIERIGVIEVYRRLKDAFPDKVTLNALWGLQGALLDIPYTQIPQSMKDELLAELNTDEEKG